MALQVRIKKHVPELILPKKIHIGDWIDLRAAETVHLEPNEYKLFSLGISVELPLGYEAHIVPRSSTFNNFGIIQANHMGIIDETYKGDNDLWMFPAIAFRPTTIHLNDRICQFRIVQKMQTIQIIEVETLGNDSRGGLGSTGIK